MEKFLELNSLPLPLLDESKEHYLKFEEVFGKPISEANQPSLVAVPTDEQKQMDRDRRSLLAATKVHTTIACGECNKPHCIYANKSDKRTRVSNFISERVQNVYVWLTSLR